MNGSGESFSLAYYFDIIDGGEFLSLVYYVDLTSSGEFFQSRWQGKSTRAIFSSILCSHKM